jgi:hypothetical protein
MSISGVVDDRAAAVIDAASLPPSSFSIPLRRTGIIRIGRGSNAVEWLTIAGNPAATAAIETDLGSTAAAWVRIANVVAGNSARGVDVRNVGAAMAGRRLHAEIRDSEFFRGIEGIFVANFVGAHGGQITVEMSGNRSYENTLGCVFENDRSINAMIHVRSNGDRFEDNGWGCRLGGGLSYTGWALSNSIILEAQGTAFINNTRTEFVQLGPAIRPKFAGILVIGGDAPAPFKYFPFFHVETSSNTVVMRLTGCRISGNRGVDIEAWGAHSSNPSSFGVHNRVLIELRGVSEQADVEGGASWPADPSGSNTLTVIR